MNVLQKYLRHPKGCLRHVKKNKGYTSKLEENLDGHLGLEVSNFQPHLFHPSALPDDTL